MHIMDTMCLNYLLLDLQFMTRMFDMKTTLDAVLQG